MTSMLVQNASYQKQAIQIILHLFPKLLFYWNQHNIIPFWTKEDGSYVTPADYGLQFLIFKALQKIFPHIPCVGEETLHSYEEAKISTILSFIQSFDPSVTEKELLRIFSPNQHDCDTFWLLDPIDGTLGFIKKKNFAIALALMQDHRPIAAIMGAPSSDKHHFKIYSGSIESGAHILCSKKKVSSSLNTKTFSKTMKFCEATLSSNNHQHLKSLQLSRTLPEIPTAYRTESQHKYALVAEKKVDYFLRYPFYASRIKSWDHAPGAFLVEAAGGIVTDLLGNPLHYGEDLYLNNHPVILATGDPSYHYILLEKLHELSHCS